MCWINAFFPFSVLYRLPADKSATATTLSVIDFSSWTFSTVYTINTDVYFSYNITKDNGDHCDQISTDKYDDTINEWHEIQSWKIIKTVKPETPSNNSRK